MTLRFAVVHEAEADFLTATELADRELIDAIDWLDEDLIGNQREWVVNSVSGVRLTWKNLKRLALEADVTPMGHFGGKSAAPDARAARRAIAYLLKEVPDLQAVLLIRDQDDERERRDGLEQARTHDHSGMVIVVGLAVVEREAWVLCGFDPMNDHESTCLQGEQQNLGFNPCTQSHELTACEDDTAKRSPKRVLHVLSNGDHDRQRHCWTETSLEVLRTRGDGNGLAAYLSEVRERLAPLIGYVPGS